MSHKSDKKEEWSKVESNSDMIWYHSLRKSKNGLFLLKRKDSIIGGIFSNIFKRVLPAWSFSGRLQLLYFFARRKHELTVCD